MSATTNGQRVIQVQPFLPPALISLPSPGIVSLARLAHYSAFNSLSCEVNGWLLSSNPWL